ncbi:ATP-dependent helicase HrpB [Corallincola luteus]|uniref:ATP-dependent helicase HrpB n=1 Tax=Corallincola luteus TaxID=1775177 RepID=A0ABY2ANJ0_9GAMM|nr:ATP-dependent helicase HrpB [Corallincola luteus]TCI04770.1 ATP-dependent helicase HrpB [Corallincola luteus]
MPLPPIASQTNEICRALNNHSMVILEAPPGAGKSTYLPLQLLQDPAFADGKILLLEPRRLAARNVASFLAKQLGETVGRTIGLRMRQETKVSAGTRLEVVTEGVLTRLLQRDPELSGVNLVIFDEYHERSLHADLGLALAYDVQQGLRDDLILLVMSATLEGMPLTERFPDAALVQCQGRSFPVSLHYQSRERRAPLAPQLAQLTEQALLAHEGSALVFLPGVYEIQQTQRALADRLSKQAQLAHQQIDIVPLYGGLTAAEQVAAIAPAAPGRRKVVLATNVAETSLTIDGISLVIDSGLHRQASYHHKIGHTRLDTVEISQASATQRAGRAGRLMPGHAYRLWSEELQSRKAKQTPADVMTVDLTAMVLELAQWGVHEPEQLHWLQLPSASLWRSAVTRLQGFGALDAVGKLTAHGRALSQLGTTPEFAQLLLWAIKNSALSGVQATAVALVALLEERLPKQPFADDLPRWLDWIKAKGAPHQELRSRILTRSSQLWQQLLPNAGRWQAQQIDSAWSGVLVAVAYPGWILGQRGASYLAAHGFGAQLGRDSHWQQASLLAVADMRDGFAGDPIIALAAPLTQADLVHYCSELISEQVNVGWDQRLGRVVATEGRYLQALPLETQPLAIGADDPRWQQGVLDGLRQRGVERLPWTPALRQWQQRVMMAAQWLPNDPWPKLDDQTLAENWDWLAPFLTAVRHPDKLTSSQLAQALKSCLDWNLGQRLEQMLPTHWTAPTGTRIALQYDDGRPPRIAVRMQEMYGQQSSPTVAGDVPVVVELLSPAGRPLQVTQDLAAFWLGSYREIQKEMKGRYPKHYWPDDPGNAQATRKTKRAMNNQ